MFHRVEKCFGFPLCKSARRYIELWFCFSEVRPHSHPGQAVEIVPLFGWSTFFRVDPESNETQRVEICPSRWFHAFSIPAGWKHWFNGAPLVFLNIASTPQSASTNIVYS